MDPTGWALGLWRMGKVYHIVGQRKLYLNTVILKVMAMVSLVANRV
jgi:hypothetical protein